MKIMKELRKPVEQSHPTGKDSSSQFELNKLITLSCITICMTSYALGWSNRRPIKPNEAKIGSRQSPIRLVLQKRKEVYRVREPIKITIFLENMSQDSSYYVGRYIDGAVMTPPFHDIEFMLTDVKGNRVSLPRGAADDNPMRVYGIDGKPILQARQSITEKLAREYVQLFPRAIYGFRKELAELELKPGHYRLRAIYRETEAASWTEAERKGLSVSIWTQPLISNTIVLTVAR